MEWPNDLTIIFHSIFAFHFVTYQKISSFVDWRFVKLIATTEKYQKLPMANCQRKMQQSKWNECVHIKQNWPLFAIAVW